MMITFDTHNYRKHNEKNKRIINKSLIECGAGRSILLDNNNVIIAGNGVFEQAQNLGLSVRIVESDGKELIAIRRTDLSTEDDKRKLLALADNHSSDTSVFDWDMILDNFSSDDIDAWEMDIDTFDCGIMDDLENGSFINAIKDASDVFTVSFSFEKKHKEMVDKYLKDNGKDNITKLIIDTICQNVEAK